MCAVGMPSDMQILYFVKNSLYNYGSTVNIYNMNKFEYGMSAYCEPKQKSSYLRGTS